MRPWIYSKPSGVVTPPPPVQRLRGVNTHLTAQRIIDNHYPNAFRFGPPVTWARVGNTTRFTPTINFAPFRSNMNAIRSINPNAAIIIDPHTCPGCTQGGTHHSDYPFYWDQNYGLNLAEYWRQVAFEFRNDTNIYYDLMNEPNEPSQSNGLSFPKVYSNISQYPSAQIDDLMAAWNANNKPATRPLSKPVWTIGLHDPRSIAAVFDLCKDAIRESDTTNTIVVGAQYSGGTWTEPGNGTGINCGPIRSRSHNASNWMLMDDINWVFSPHLYWPSGYTGDFAPGEPGVTTRPTRAQIVNELNDLRAWKLANNVRYLVGEFGVVYTALEADAYLTDMIDVLEDEGWDWIIHTLTYNGPGAGFDIRNSTSMLAVLHAAYDLNPIS